MIANLQEECEQLWDLLPNAWAAALGECSRSEDQWSFGGVVALQSSGPEVWKRRSPSSWRRSGDWGTAEMDACCLPKTQQGLESWVGELILTCCGDYRVCLRTCHPYLDSRPQHLPVVAAFVLPSFFFSLSLLSARCRRLSSSRLGHEKRRCRHTLERDAVFSCLPRHFARHFK